MNRAVAALQDMRGIRRPILAGLVIIVVLPLISLWATYRIDRLSERIATVDNARLDLSLLLRYVLDEETGVRGFVDTRAVSFLQPYLQAHPQIESLLARLPTDFRRAGLSRALPALRDIAGLHAAWHVNVAEPLLANPRRADSLSVQEDGKRIIDKMRADVGSVQTMAAAYAHQSSHEIFQVMVVSGVLAVMWIVVVGAWTIVVERRTMRHEMALVQSIVGEREAVERLSDWRSRLLAMLAHDFKSQLAVVIGAAHLLEDFPTRLGDPQILNSLRSAGYNLAEMADNAILLARAQERRLVLQRTAFDISEVIHGVVERYGEEREFNLHSNGRAAMVDGDRSYVTRVIDNIIGNAVKYSDHPVDIHVAEEEEHVCVSVADRGIGIGDTDLPHIFEEFWRSENMLWSKKGSGVGLFIVKQIMEAHGGSIRVESALGKGTTVLLRFRRAAAAIGFADTPPADHLKTAT